MRIPTWNPMLDARINAAAGVLEAAGFREDEVGPMALAPLLPFVAFPPPYDVIVGARGEVEGRAVRLFEYVHGGGGDPSQGARSALLVLVEHPWVVGSAAVTMDWKAWSSFVALVDALAWIPPFTVVKALQYLESSRQPDRKVGHPEFDRRYVVHAASDEAARAAVPRAFCEHLVATNFRGAVELRPGLLMFTPEGCHFDPPGVTLALDLARGMAPSFTPPAGHPMR